MKFKHIYLFLFIFLFSCVQNIKNVKVYEEKNYKAFSSKGFALLYEDSLFKDKIITKKLKNDDFVVLHSQLKKNTQK